MSNKAELVDRIKTIQRTDQEAKQQWWDYCDLNLGGVKDPNRHDASVLEEFLAAYGSGNLVPGVPSSGSARPQKRSAPPPDMGGYGFSKGGYDSHYRGPSHSFTPAAPPPPVYDGWNGYGGYQGQWSDEADSSIAEMIKTGQRKSQHWKAAWQSYCSKCGTGFNDPTRYDDQFLVGFLDYVGQLVLQDMGPDGYAPAHHAPPEPPIGSGMKRPVGGGGAPPLQPPAKRAATGSVDQRRGGYNNPPAWSPENDFDKGELVDRIKTLQRTNPEAKAAWWSFCEEFQQGVKDPSRHEKSVLLKFLQGFD